MGRLIDSSVLITLQRRDAPLRTFFSLYDESEGFAIASITASEIIAGVLRATTDRRAARSVFVEGVLETIPVIPLDLAVARVHARIGQEVEANGGSVGAYDLIIAATAIHMDYEVVTFNLREFRHVPGLRVEQPNW